MEVFSVVPFSLSSGNPGTRQVPSDKAELDLSPTAVEHGAKNIIDFEMFVLKMAQDHNLALTCSFVSSSLDRCRAKRKKRQTYDIYLKAKARIRP